MKLKMPSYWSGYVLAVAATIVAAWLHVLAAPYLGDNTPFITFFPAIFVTAFFAGFGPTLLAVVLSGLTATYNFIPPENSILPLNVAAWTGLVLFSLSGVGIALLSKRMQRSTAQLKRDYERFSATLASIGDGVIVADESARVTFMNSIAEQLTGWSLVAAQGNPLDMVFQIVNERPPEKPENPIVKAEREERIVGLTNHSIMIAKDGSERAIDVSAAPIRSTEGQIVGSVLVFRDATRHRESQRGSGRLAAPVDSSGEAVIGQDFDGFVTDWNVGATQMFGFSAEETTGKPIFSTNVPPELKLELLEILHRIEQGERIEQFETVRQCKDGSRIPVSIRISPIHNAYGEVIGASAIDRDISQRKKAEDRRNARLAVTQLLARKSNIETALRESLAAICTAFAWKIGCYWRYHPDEGVLRCQEFWERSSQDVKAFRSATMQHTLEPGTTLPGRVLSKQTAEWIRDVAVEPPDARAQQARESGLHGGIACPVAMGENFLGVMEFYSHEILPREEHLLETITIIGSQIGQFIERQQAVQQLQRSERELADFFENAAVGLHWVGPDGIVLRVNQAELDMLGYSREEYVGRYISDFHVDQAVIQDILERQRVGEQLRDREARLRCKDGSIRHVLIDSNVLWENGEFIHTRSFTRDITERKKLETSLRFLSEASKSLSTLIDFKSTLQMVAQLAVPDFADWCTVDIRGPDNTLQRLAVAHQDEKKVELADEVYQRSPHHFDNRSSHGVTKVFRTGKPVMATEISDDLLNEVAENDEHLQFLRELDLKSYLCVPLKTKNGTLGVISFLSAKSGRLYGPKDLAIAEDLAHRAGIAVENARLYEQLREADRRKDDFLAMLAHELRNPLVPICSGLDLLAMDSGNHHETVIVMQEQMEHVVRLVDDLLDVSRILQGRIELRKESVELDHVVRRSTDAVRPLLHDRDQELTISIPEQSIWLNADPVRLVQVLENLLNNASKYTDIGGRIELTADHRDGQTFIRVRDTGMGIEPDLLMHVFDLFTQSSRTLDRAQGGLGIGLTLVHKLVQMHGGEVTAESKGAGHGSTFTVRLPVAEEPAAESGTPLQPQGVAHSLRILVVDDNVGASYLLRKLLENLNEHQVETSHDGPSAVEKIKEFHPHLALLDIGLPGMDGYQVAREIRQHDRFDDVLLVALTGYGQEDDKRKSKEAGFDEHLVKPPSMDQIKEILSHPKLLT